MFIICDAVFSGSRAVSRQSDLRSEIVKIVGAAELHGEMICDNLGTHCPDGRRG